jgi:hypothetical protein
MAEPSALHGMRLAVEHLTTALALLALLRVVHLPMGDASHAVSVVVPRSVAQKKVLRGVVPLYFIDVVNGLPGPQEAIVSFRYQDVFINPSIVGARMFWNCNLDVPVFSQTSVTLTP